MVLFRYLVFNYVAFEKQYNSKKELIKLKENLELFTEIKEYTQDYHLNQEKINNLYIRNGYCNDDIYDLYNNIRTLNWLLLQIRKKKFIMAEFKKLNP